MRQEGEASVEEILESIKKVIARDHREGVIEARRRRHSEAEELSEAAAEPAPEPAPEPANAEEAEEVLELDAEAMVEAEEVEEVESHDADDAPETVEADGPLLTEAARQSMRDNLAALAMLAEPGARPQIVRSGETSLESLVREMLRPMLADWLDKHLPPMVERLVREEIARVAGKRAS